MSERAVSFVFAALVMSACSGSPGGGDGDGGSDRPAGSVLHHIGSAGPEYTKALSSDPDGNILAAVVFGGAVDLGSAITLTASATDVAVIRYDAATGAVMTAFSFGGTGGQVPHGVAAAGEDIVTIGYTLAGAAGVASIVNLDPAGAVSGNRAVSGGEKPFVTRHADSGELLWGVVFDHPLAADTNVRLWDVAVDDANDIYAVGSFSGSLDLDPGPGEQVAVSSADSADLFLVKLSGESGALLWGFSVGGPGNDAGTQAAVAPGGTGDASVTVIGDSVFLLGGFEQSARLAPAAAETRVSRGATDNFIAHYNAGDGTLVAARTFGSSADDGSSPGVMRTDDAGNLFFAVEAHGTTDLSELGGSASAPSPENGILFVSLDAELQLRWTRAVSCSGTTTGAHRVLPGEGGAVYAAGWLQGSCDFEGQTGLRIEATPAGLDMFVARISPDEDSVSWASGILGSPGHSTNGIVAGLALDRFGDPWIGGQFFTDTDFDPASEQRLLGPAGANDAFVARYRQESGLLE